MPAKRLKKTRWNALNQGIADCELCPRLVQHCRHVAKQKRRAFMEWNYWGRPVPNFGDPRAQMLIVGLAPAAHGANRTGRMFTGDRSGDWLYGALHRAGFASQPNADSSDDGLTLIDCAITAICHCAPPQNKPTRDEIAACRPWLVQTIDLLAPKLFLALGQIAWKGILDVLIESAAFEGRRPKFAHGATVKLSGQRWLLASYHPSQQNTFTGRLTEPMLDSIFKKAKRLVT